MERPNAWQTYSADQLEELERITLRAMEPDLRKRYQSAGEMLRCEKE